MASQYQSLLEQVTRFPNRPIRSHFLAPRRSDALLPSLLQQLEKPHYPLVTEMCMQSSNHEAVRQGGRAWTYGELTRAALNIAEQLRIHGGRKKVVGITGEKSFGVYASMLGILLSGGVLLPLGHNLPIAQLRHMLRITGCHCLVHIGKLEDSDAWIRDIPELTLVQVDAAKGTPDLIAAFKTPESGNNSLEDSAAYIFFTSGTTRMPQAVLGRHQSLSHFICWQRQRFDIGPGDRCAQLTGLSFDVLMRDVFTPLASGATLCLPPDPNDLSNDQIMPWLDSEQITMLHTVPTLARSWLHNLPAGIRLETLRLIFFAGEPLLDNLVGRWRQTFPASKATMINLYGSTEATLAQCAYIEPVDPLLGVQPVGWPLPHTQALVLGHRRKLCGVGEPGEIYIRTPFLTAGYLNASRENRRRFVPNPFSREPSDLMFRTGDLGRYRPDGSLEILGRLDHRVKIRGVRVDPAQVSAILTRHPAVEEGIVVGYKDQERSDSLIAFVVPRTAVTVSASELRSYLTRHLTPAMIPSAFTFLKQLPRTTNGKIDLSALPSPEESTITAPTAAPGSRTEKMLAEIWASLLGKRIVSTHDDFFELGGNSLLAIQVSTRIRQVFHIPIPAAALFETPTIAELAGRVEQTLVLAVGATEVMQLLDTLKAGEHE